MGNFIGSLFYQKIKSATLTERAQYKLTAPLGYKTGKVKNDTIFTAPAGFVTDFASIPRYDFLLHPTDKNWARAAAIHDWCCKLARGEVRQGTTTLDLKDADDILFQAMRDCGASYAITWAFYLSVRSQHKVLG